MSAAAALLDTIARDVAALGGNGAGFAYSMDRLDHTWPEAIRRNAADLAKLVAGDAELTARAHVALCWACVGDDWATKEVAGRFLRGARRVEVLRALARHPRADRFESLRAAVLSGRFTAGQWQLACKLAQEAA